MHRMIFPSNGPLAGKRVEVRYLPGQGWPLSFPETLEVPWEGRLQVYAKERGKYIWKQSRACAIALRTELVPGIYITEAGQVLDDGDDISGGFVQTDIVKELT